MIVTLSKGVTQGIMRQRITKFGLTGSTLIGGNSSDLNGASVSIRSEGNDVVALQDLKPIFTWYACSLFTYLAVFYGFPL